MILKTAVDGLVGANLFAPTKAIQSAEIPQNSSPSEVFRMILVTGGAGFIGANFSFGITRLRALAFTEIRAESFVTQEAAS